MAAQRETWIVTGGAGFIGCNFVRHALAHADARLVVLDLLTYAGSLENLRDVIDGDRVVFVQGDIADAEAVAAVYRDQRPSAVVNFAAESHVDRSIEAPRAFLTTNVAGTFELLEGARRHLAGADAATRDRFRFLHVSTDEVYGTLGSDGLFSENTPYAPNSPYSASKAAADHFVRAYQHTFGVPTLVTNCSNNYGPYQFPEKLIPLIILNAIEGRDLPIYGDGLNVRDWLYVEDHCAGVALVLDRGRPGEKYNIGGSNERTNLDVVDTLCRELERVAPSAENAALRGRGYESYARLKIFVADRPGHDRRYAIDASKIARDLGWAPRHDVASGLARTVRWYVEHRPWCDAVQRGRYSRQRLGLASPEAGPTGD